MAYRVCLMGSGEGGLVSGAEVLRAEAEEAGGGDGDEVIVLSFDAMNAFLDAEQVDLFRIVHGEQRFVYTRSVVPGDVLTATLTVASLRQIGGADIIGTTSEVVDADGDLVCTTTATLVHTGAGQ